jgi:hypothetical protein
LLPRNDGSSFFPSFWAEVVLEMLNNQEKQRVQVSRRGLLPHVGARMICQLQRTTEKPASVSDRRKYCLFVAFEADG